MAATNQPLRLPYKHIDNIPLPTDIYIPSQPLRNPIPVLIMIHGGAFMLGHSKMNNKDQIEDCLERGWIVLAIEHRLCPGVNILEGPMTDVRDALEWAQTGGLQSALEGEGVGSRVDGERVMAMGTSSGGHLALSLAYGVPKPPLAILDFYGAKGFADPFWLKEVPAMKAHLESPPLEKVEALRKEKHTFIGGASLEGQSSSSAESPDPKIRQAFAMHCIASGQVINTIWPQAPNGFEQIDPLLNVTKNWPPTAIVHGTADETIPMRLSKELEARLLAEGVEADFTEVPGEPHTFVGKMVKGSDTWNIQRKGFDFLEKVLSRSYE